jgi:hypothetical protein
MLQKMAASDATILALAGTTLALSTAGALWRDHAAYRGPYTTLLNVPAVHNSDALRTWVCRSKPAPGALSWSSATQRLV